MQSQTETQPISEELWKAMELVANLRAKEVAKKAKAEEEAWKAVEEEDQHWKEEKVSLPIL